MKEVVLRLDNIQGNCADVVEPNGTIIVRQWCFASMPPEVEEKPTKAEGGVPLNKLLQLKEAGFTADEILSLNREGAL